MRPLVFWELSGATFISRKQKESDWKKLNIIGGWAESQDICKNKLSNNLEQSTVLNKKQ
jgi:hypothetical protein